MGACCCCAVGGEDVPADEEAVGGTALPMEDTGEREVSVSFSEEGQPTAVTRVWDAQRRRGGARRTIVASSLPADALYFPFSAPGVELTDLGDLEDPEEGIPGLGVDDTDLSASRGDEQTLGTL